MTSVSKNRTELSPCPLLNPLRWAHWQWEHRRCRYGDGRSQSPLHPSEANSTKPIV
jgi:hypothetical protein